MFHKVNILLNLLVRDVAKVLPAGLNTAKPSLGIFAATLQSETRQTTVLSESAVERYLPSAL